MENTVSQYNDYEKFKNEVLYVFSDMIDTRRKSFEEQLTKFETTE